MKNYKRIISAVLVIMLILSTFTVAFAATDGVKVVRAYASDGSGYWEYDPDYGYFDIVAGSSENGTEAGVEEGRVRDYNSAVTTLNFNYGEGLFVRMYTDENGTKTIGDKTIKTAATESFYTLYCGTTDREVGEVFYPDENEKIGGRMLDKKIRDIHSATNFCYQSYDLGGGKLGADDPDYGQIYVYVLTETFDNAYNRQICESLPESDPNYQAKAELAPVDYPDKYYGYGDKGPDYTNTTLSANASATSRNVIIAKFPISVTGVGKNTKITCTVDGENTVNNSTNVNVGDSFKLSAHTQYKSTWGWDAADGWCNVMSFSYSTEDTDIINLDTETNTVTALANGTAKINVTLKANNLGLWEENSTTFEVNVGLVPGVSVVKDSASPTGYMANFVYEDAEAENVNVVGRFMFYKEGDSTEYTPWEWENGMFPAMINTEYSQPMTKAEGTDYWVGQFPIPSGAFHYYYDVDGVRTTDPANKPLENLDKNRSSSSGYLSIVYGIYDEEYQSESDDCTDWNPAEMNGVSETGTITSMSYTDTLGQTKYLGIYLPPGYDENREEPYKVIYMSHGGGGNLTDWLSHGYVGNIMDNLLAQGRTKDAIIVTMTNSDYSDFGKSYVNGTTETPARYNLAFTIVDVIEENFNVSTYAKDRALIGLSAGGQLVSRLMYQYPTRFGYFGILSTAGSDVTSKINAGEIPEELYDANIFVGAGNVDNYTSLVNLYQAMDNANIEVHSGDVVWVHGAHDWATWPGLFEIMLDDFLWKDDVVVTSHTSKAETNGEISIEVTAPTDVIGFAIQNETGNKIFISSVSKSPSDNGNINWTIKTKVATAGNRILELIPVSKTYGVLSSFEIPVEVVKRADAYDVKSVSFSSKAVLVNEEFKVTTVTGSGVSSIAIRNENGANMGKQLVAKTLNSNDDTITWIHTTKIGTAGLERTLSSYARNASGEYESYKSATIAVVQ